MTVAAYMTEILTHPASGYYMGKDVLGPEGDFITSPEISQMFGELIGLWFVSEWINAGAPGNFEGIGYISHGVTHKSPNTAYCFYFQSACIFVSKESSKKNQVNQMTSLQRNSSLN